MKVRETTFQQELREAKDPNWELFWTLDRVESIGDPQQAKRIYFRTGKGIRGYFKIKGFQKLKRLRVEHINLLNSLLFILRVFYISIKRNIRTICSRMFALKQRRINGVDMN